MPLPDHTQVLQTTQSLCPFCMQVLDAQITAQDGKVFMHKSCPDHGPMNVYLWPDVDHYKWFEAFRFPCHRPLNQTEIVQGCPYDCGLCPAHLRAPTLVEIEVTQRCNLTCPVCFMSAGTKNADPSYSTMHKMFASILSNAGSQVSIQLTGGEPTIREDLSAIVRLGQAMGFSAIEINTNGLVISRHPKYLRELKQAGITGIYLQFDGLTPDVYQRIRGRDFLSTKLQAIENCRAEGVQAVLAMTVIWGVNHDQIGAVLDFALNNIDVVAGLALQPAFTSGRFEVSPKRRLTMGDVVFLLAGQSAGRISPYDLWPLGCSHPLCSCATQLLVDGESVRPMTQEISEQDYRARFDPRSPQGSVFADILADLQSDGQFPSCYKPYPRSLSVVVMNYMDAWTLELKRLQECSMTVAMIDGRLIPFCAYQLTNCEGQRIYPAWGEEQIETFMMRKNVDV